MLLLCVYARGDVPKASSGLFHGCQTHGSEGSQDHFAANKLARHPSRPAPAFRGGPGTDIVGTLYVLIIIIIIERREGVRRDSA